MNFKRLAAIARISEESHYAWLSSFLYFCDSVFVVMEALCGICLCLILNFDEVSLAILETNGKISVIKKEDEKEHTLKTIQRVFKPKNGGIYG